MKLTMKQLAALLQYRADAEDGPKERDRPSRWWDAHTWRCANDHVSTRYLKSEALYADVCLACHGPFLLTFPEDVEGPLPEVVLERGTYRHYKGGQYEVFCLELDADTDEVRVSYRSVEDNQRYSRLIEEFLRPAEVDGKRVPRYRFWAAPVGRGD